MSRLRPSIIPLTLGLVMAGCSVAPSPSPSALRTLEPSLTAEPTSSVPVGLRLPTPASRDQTAISYKVTVELEAGKSGRVVVEVTNLTDTMVPELVLRWPTAVKATVFLAPFAPSQQRIREGGDPLVQAWTKWVDGPGEHGEPAGTTSLGWGPLLPGGTLTIPVLATRVAPGPLTFDLQILNGEKVLSSDGAAAWTQVTVP